MEYIDYQVHTIAMHFIVISYVISNNLIIYQDFAILPIS